MLGPGRVGCYNHKTRDCRKKAASGRGTMPPRQAAEGGGARAVVGEMFVETAWAHGGCGWQSLGHDGAHHVVVQRLVDGLGQ